MGFFRNAMNSYYFGKSGKGDFTEENLPTNRLQLFWEMLRIRFSSLIKLNLIYMICWIPAMIVLCLGVSAFFNIMAGEAEGAELTTQLSQAMTSMLVCLIPCIAITGPFTAGISYVTRNWARDEHSFLFADFKDAVKANWKQALPVSIFTGFLPMIGWTCWCFYGDMAKTMGPMIIAQALIVMMMMIAAISITYVYPLIVTYELKLKDILRNALLISLARAPISLLVRLLHCLPFAIGCFVFFFVNPAWGMTGTLLYYALIGFALSRFVTASVTNAAFDRFINPRIEGAQVGRGLARRDPDDEADDEDEDAEA